MGQRRRGREYALQMLFQMDLSGNRPDDVFPAFWEGHEVEATVREFAERLVQGVVCRGEGIDRAIAHSAEHWKLERMATVDRNVLRLAVYELMFEGETPAAVAIDEAIEIAKKFGSEDSGGFINGVLDAVRRRLDHGELSGV